MLKISDLSLTYPNKKTILKDFNLQAEQGELILLKGRNGCGKTSLLHAICGIIPHHLEAEVNGSISFKGQAVHKKNSDEIFGMLYQNPDHQLFFPETMQELVFSLENRLKTKSEINKRLSCFKEEFPLEKLLKHNPLKMSFGEKKMLCLTSLLMDDPPIILIDEFSNGLSQFNMNICLNLIKKKDKIWIISEHSDHLDSLADRIVRL